MNDNLKLNCFIKGVRRRLTFAEAIRVYFESSYSWLLPIDRYRWNVQGKTGSAYVCELVTPTPRRFAYYLHTQATHVLTIDALAEFEHKRIEARTFQSHASRFRKIFGDLPSELLPYFIYPVESNGLAPAPAYRMRSSRTWCVVEGIAPGQVLDGDVVDWSPFED